MADPIAGRQVLIVEDDPQLLEAMARAFSKAGARVSVAANGADGLKRFGPTPPDLVVTDIIMPEREGLETIMAMKASRPGVPILAISGGGRTPAGEFLKVARTLGADAVLAKPFRAQALLDAARDLMPSLCVDAAA